MRPVHSSRFIPILENLIRPFFNSILEREEKRPMSQIVSEIKCPNCGAQLNLSPGELVATCRYCGYTSVVGANSPFQLQHSLIVNNLNNTKRNDSERVRLASPRKKGCGIPNPGLQSPD